MASIQREDVQQWTHESSPVVKVQGVEKGPEEYSQSTDSANTEEQASAREVHIHDAGNLVTSYDVEEDASPSLFQRLKGKFLGAEDKLPSVDDENSDPDPAVTPAQPSIFSKAQQSIWGKKDGHDDKLESASSGSLLPESRAPREVERPIETSFQMEQSKRLGTDELGTGYEEDSEKGVLSPQSSTDMSENEGPFHSARSLFQPVEAMDRERNSEDVKAPGGGGRAKEELEAVTDNLKGALNRKVKQDGSGDEKETANQGGFFNRIAEKIGYKGLQRRKSH